MSTLETNLIQPASGTTLTVGASGDTVSVPTGATLDVTNATVTGLPASGKVLQVVTATDSTERTTTSASFVTASNTLVVSITPSSISSKIFIIASASTQSTPDYGYFTIYRNAVNLGATNGMMRTFGGGGEGGSFSGTILDSPATTSATTYQVYFKAQASATTKLNNASTKGSITAWEISA